MSPFNETVVVVEKLVPSTLPIRTNLRILLRFLLLSLPYGRCL